VNFDRAEWVERTLKKRLTEFQRIAVELICQAQGCGPYDFAQTFIKADWHYGTGVRFVISPMRLSTFDASGLTSLVIGAHDHCIRVEIMPVNMQRLAVIMHPRQREGREIWSRHPSIEDAIKIYRR
jgi:hypothetical protein